MYVRVCAAAVRPFVKSLGTLVAVSLQVKKTAVNGSEVAEPVTPQWRTINRDDDAERPMTAFEFDGLKERASYEVKVRMRNSIDWSAYNQPFVFTTSHGLILRWPRVGENETRMLG